MKWRLVASVVVTVAVLCVAAPVAADQQYACTDQSCVFAVPDSYSVASNDAAQIIFQDAASGGAFSVAATDGSMYGSLDDAVNSLASAAAGSDSYQAGPSNGKNTTLGGNPATIIEYVAKNSSGTLVETANFVTLYHGKLYQLIFVTTPENEDAFVSGAQGVFNSWQFT
jgi:hypothetical protein